MEDMHFGNLLLSAQERGKAGLTWDIPSPCKFPALVVTGRSWGDGGKGEHTCFPSLGWGGLDLEATPEDKQCWLPLGSVTGLFLRNVPHQARETIPFRAQAEN
jgi:hypothetical protein